MATLQKAEGYSVFFTTLKEEMQAVVPEKQKELMMKLFQAFGCMSMFLDENNIKEMKSIQVNGEQNQVEPGFYVIVVQDFTQGLSEKELGAVILHEIGHVLLEHHAKMKSGQAATVNNILVDVNLELEADAYAVKYVGKEIMKSALEKVITATVSLCENMARKANKPFHRDVYLHELFTSEHIKPRLAALS